MDERLEAACAGRTSLGLDKDRHAWAGPLTIAFSLARQQAAKLENASRPGNAPPAASAGVLRRADPANYDTVEFQMQTVAHAVPLQYGDFRAPRTW